MSRARRCRMCKKPLVTSNTLQVACSPSCALKLARTKREREEAREQAKAREAVKTRKEWLAETQEAFNAFIRARDAAKPCVSCGRMPDGRHQRHAGHYRSVGSNPALRFEPDNVWGQCATCNNHLSGNLVPYRAELIRRIGLERVEWLEGPHEACKYTGEQLQEMKKRYRKMARQMAQNGDAPR